MKKLLFLTALSVLPVAAQWRHFGDGARPTGYFGVGAATAINPAATRLDTGWTLSGGVGVVNRYVGVLLDANFTDFGINSETLRRAGAPRGSQKYWSLTANPIFHVNQRGPVDFYVTAGGGLYGQITDFRFRFDGGPFGGGDDLRFSNTIYKPGVNGGAGFAFNVGGWHNRVKVFTEARFHHMFIGRSGVSYIPVTVGVRF